MAEAGAARAGAMSSNSKWMLTAGGLLVLLALSDFMLAPNAGGVEAQKQSKFTSKLMGPTIKFMYCYSWGYRKVFEQYAGLLQQKYPTLAIEGDNFPPPTWKWQLAQILGYTKLAIIICVLASFNPFVYLGEGATPSAFQWAMDNKLYACMMLFFIGNAIESQLISTGAFEISIDSMPLWSKIESGRIPQPPELFQILENHFKMNAGQDHLGAAAAAGAANSYKDEL